MRYILKITFFIIMMLYSSISYALDVVSHVPENPSKAILMMHGLGGNARSVSWLTKKLEKDFPDMAFFYPTAPDKASNGGFQWFEIPTLGEALSEEKIYDIIMQTALLNVGKLHDLIEHIHQKTQIEYDNIYIAGFSQGGFMAILTAITNNKRIGKVVSFSGVPILLTKDFKQSDVKSKPEILVIQGDKDYVIPNNSYRLTQDTLNILNMAPNTKVIKNLGHSINDEAIKSAIEFLK